MLLELIIRQLEKIRAKKQHELIKMRWEKEKLEKELSILKAQSVNKK